MFLPASNTLVNYVPETSSEEVHNLVYYVRAAIVFLCGSLSTTILSGTFFLVVKYYRQETQALRLVVIASFGVWGEMIAEVNSYPTPLYEHNPVGITI